MKIAFKDKTDYRIVKCCSWFGIFITSFLLFNYIAYPNLPDRQIVIITQIIGIGLSIFVYYITEYDDRPTLGDVA